MKLIKAKTSPVILIVVVAVCLMARQGFAADESGFQGVILDLSYSDIVATVTPQQTLDLYRAKEQRKSPVVIFVHGGGWAFGDKADVGKKPAFFNAHGLAFISMNYRLRWDYTIFDQLTDVVSVVKWVEVNADKYGLDSRKIILMGVASGAHLVSLVGTDERYLKIAGLSFAQITAVVAVEGTTFDLQQNIEVTAGFIENKHLKLIFGDKPEVWQAASPVTYVEADKGIPSFAILYLSGDETSAAQANLFAKKLSEAKVETVIMPAETENSADIDQTLGARGDRSSLALVTFIKAKI